tara:strand:+ start:1950 stop:2051 length:102 start_codon:yes stop_codon:yes gene_type:complete
LAADVMRHQESLTKRPDTKQFRDHEQQKMYLMP